MFVKNLASTVNRTSNIENEFEYHSTRIMGVKYYFC